ncbi:MAG TPA: MCP four helix bundle domain-containing protein, partial [Sphingobium sp.]
MRATIKLKLGAAFALIIIMLLIVGVLSISRMSTLNTAITNVIYGPAKRMELALRANNGIGTLMRMERNMMIATDPKRVAKFNEESRGNLKLAEQVIDDGQKIATDDTKVYWANLRESFNEYRPVNERVRAFAMDHQIDQARDLSLSESSRISGEMEDNATQLISLAQAEMKKTDSDTDAMYAAARNTVVGVAVLALLMAIGSAIWISLTVSRGLKRVGAAVDAVAVGDLDQEILVTTNDEIRDLVTTVNAMTANLRKTADLADRIAGGDLTVEHVALSDKDRLGHALIAMIERLRGVVADAGG